MDHSTIEAFAVAFASAPRLAEMEVRSLSQGTLRFRRSLLSAEVNSRPTIKATTVRATETVTAIPAALPRSDDTVVTSTLVGIFRAARKVPVAVGSRVEAGQTIGMIEVMRLSDEVTATISGEVSAVFVIDGQPVEYGQPLFEIAADVAEEETENDA